MAAPTDIQRPSETERTQAAGGRADRTAVAVRTGVLSTGGFGPPLERGEIGTLGPYRIVRELGKGGMGAVYAAIDTRLNRKLALKVMLPECAADADAKERFLREARAAAQISHDNVVTVYEADERDGVPYIAMQFLEGYPLDQFIKKKGLPTIPQTLRLARETAAGLAAAHRLGLVHRDIKPGNLWLEAPNGRVKVLDFGLAKIVHTDTELTQSGMVVGTPAYMSPEQARGKKVDERSDLFSLGAVLYRLCTGQLPFDGPTTMAVLMALGTEEPRPVNELNPECPESLTALIHQLLAKEPEDRPQSALEVGKWLQAIANSTGASQVVVTPSPRVVYVQTPPPAATGPNPFADLDSTEVEATVPITTGSASRKIKTKKKPRVPLLWIAAGLAGLFAVAAVVAAVVVGTRKSAEPKPEPTPATPPASKTKPAPAKPPVSADPDRSVAQWVLTLNGTIQINGEERELRFPEDIPADKFTLTGINLTDRTVADAELAQVAECKSLTRVILHGTRVTDAGVAHLKGLTQLQHLSFAHCRITDAGFAHVKSFPGLLLLWAQDTLVTDAGLEALKELHALTRVDLSGTRITGPGLVNLNGTKGLTLLINGIPISDANMEHLKGLTGVIDLALNETAISDAGLPPLRNLKSLSLLSVRRTKTTPQGLLNLHPHMPECRIELDGGFIVPFDMNRVAAERSLAAGGSVRVAGTDREIRTPAELPPGKLTLTRVNLSNKPVGDNDLLFFVPCRGLTELVLHGTKVTDKGIELIRTFSGLQFLSLTSTEVTDAGLARLTNLKGLKTLHLSGTKITDAGLVQLKEFPELTELFLSQTGVTDGGLVHLKVLEKLTAVELDRTKVTNKGIDQLKGLKALTSLSVREAEVTATGAAGFSAAVPGCKVEREFPPPSK